MPFFIFLQPYITKAIFSTEDPPVNLHKIAIGNGAMGAEPEYEELPTVGTRAHYTGIFSRPLLPSSK